MRPCERGRCGCGFVMAASSPRSRDFRRWRVAAFLISSPLALFSDTIPPAMLLIMLS